MKLAFHFVTFVGTVTPKKLGNLELFALCEIYWSLSKFRLWYQELSF